MSELASPLAEPSGPDPGAVRVGRDVVLPAVGVVLAGVVVGLVWWLLAPTGAVVRAQGYLAPVADGGVGTPGDVWQASQDGVFSLAVLGAGVVCGLLLVVRAGRGPRMVARWVTGVVAGLVASVLAWGVGVLLGPASVAAQQAAGADPLVSPLRLSSPAPLLLWSAATCTVVFVVALVSMLAHPPADDP